MGWTAARSMPATWRCARDEALALGGFDERRSLRPLAAEDNDFCYRWLKSGRALRYEPAMTVWHHDWRTPEQLVERYAEYAKGQGAFYAKHLSAGDHYVLSRWIWPRPTRRRGARRQAALLARTAARVAMPRRSNLYWLPVGVRRRLARGAPARAAELPSSRSAQAPFSSRLRRRPREAHVRQRRRGSAGSRPRVRWNSAAGGKREHRCDRPVARGPAAHEPLGRTPAAVSALAPAAARRRPPRDGYG